MSKKKTQRVRRGRPQAARPRERPRKGPQPKPALKPAPPSRWQRLRARPWLLAGLIVLAVLLVFGAAWLVFRLTRPSQPAPTATAAPEAAETPLPQASPAALIWQEPPPLTIDTSKAYTATIVTDRGQIVAQLFADRAPKTVNSFVFLARQGFYDGLTFHRVLPGFMAQGGDPTGTGAGGPGYQFEDEIDPELKFDSAGILAMANSGPDTNGSQFFITYAPAPWLNGQHTIFGRVVAGMGVAEGLTPRNPDENPTTPGDRIVTIRITEG
ncbi:MAG: peptidylprolyl isomerase [Anaerolineae bacterium]|nr:peptidylprolyl isomerase [Anaerolineae bacterium]